MLWKEHISQVALLEKEDMVLGVEWEEKVGEKHFPEEDQKAEKDYPHRFND